MRAADPLYLSTSAFGLGSADRGRLR